MTLFLLRTSNRLFPEGSNRHGILPVMLVALTMVTGIVDAVSYLGLGHVFVANMTGNLVFAGFALAGDTKLSVWASVLAVGAFALGAWIAGRLLHRAPSPYVKFTAATCGHAALVSTAMIVALCTAPGVTGGQVALIVLLGCGMGMQNAMVRKFPVPDMTTTVLTFTVAGIAADTPGLATVRRVVSVLAMFVGAACGATLHLRVGPAAALAPAVFLLAVIIMAAHTRHFRCNLSGPTEASL